MNISGRGDLSEALQHIRTSGTCVALKGRTLLYVTMEAAHSAIVCVSYKRGNLVVSFILSQKV